MQLAVMGMELAHLPELRLHVADVLVHNLELGLQVLPAPDLDHGLGALWDLVELCLMLVSFDIESHQVLLHILNLYIS